MGEKDQPVDAEERTAPERTRLIIQQYLYFTGMNKLPMAAVYIVNIFPILGFTKSTHIRGSLGRVSLWRKWGTIQIFEGSEYLKGSFFFEE